MKAVCHKGGKLINTAWLGKAYLKNALTLPLLDLSRL